MLESLDNNGHLLIDLIPDLELIIGMHLFYNIDNDFN